MRLPCPIRTGRLRLMSRATDRRGSYRTRLLTVPTVAIDSMVEAGAVSLPACLKVDVEGAEYQVLIGARNTLMRARPTVFLATHGPEFDLDCRTLLTSMGYSCRQFGRDENEFIACPMRWQTRP